MMIRGFTIVELSLVIAIVFVLAAFIFPVSSDFLTRQKLEETERMLVNMLRTAEKFSTEGKGSVPHGVKVSEDSITRFEGESYETRTISKDEVYTLGGTVGIKGPDEIIFEVYTGVPHISGEAVLIPSPYRVFADAHEKEVVVYQNGLVSK